MKPCPSCGYEGTPTDRQILRLHRKHFGGLPIREMIKRGWLKVADPLSLFELRSELRRFLVANSPIKIVRNDLLN